MCEVSTVSDGLGSHVICWCGSIVFYQLNTAVYQDILEHFMLPAADKLFGDDDFIFQQDLAPKLCQSLIASMPRRLDAVISAKGGPTKY